MKTKAEYMEMAVAAIAEHPTAALAYQVRDPRLLAMLEAMATMLSMHSMEIDTAAMEPWTKARDMTVLADASVKGVLPFGTPAQYALTVENIASIPLEVAAGRRLMDQQGRVYVTTAGASVPVGEQATIHVTQQTESVIVHVVSESRPFYRITVPAPEIGHIASISLMDGLDNEFTYTPEFTNVAVGSRIFHLETDESRVLTVVFGAKDIAGYQPGAGEEFRLGVVVTEGDVALEAGASFIFEHTANMAESGAKITLAQVLRPGAAPMDIATMREVTSYPSLYDGSAVFLANFDFLIRRNLPAFRFLSVWNEQREELVRGPNVENMNCIFVAAAKDGVDDDTLHADIARVITAADDSYRIRRVAVSEVEIQVSVILRVPNIYDSEEVKQKAREIVLGEYGRDSVWAKRGSGRVLYRKITSILEAGIQACRAEGADVQVSVTDDAVIMPESYRYISQASLHLSVEAVQ